MLSLEMNLGLRGQVWRGGGVLGHIRLIPKACALGYRVTQGKLTTPALRSMLKGGVADCG